MTTTRLPDHVARIISDPSEIKFFEAHLQVYDARARTYLPLVTYLRSPKTARNYWVDQVLAARREGYTLCKSAEWHKGRGYVLDKFGEEAEEDFVTGLLEWTGTVLDFEHGELLEDIKLREDMNIERARADPYSAIESATRLGKDEGIFLPKKSGLVRDLPGDCTLLVSHLYGVENPADIHDAFLYVYPEGFKPVVRGCWGWHRRGDGRVDVNASCGPADWRFAARLVSRTRPDAITMEEYETAPSQEKPLLIS